MQIIINQFKYTTHIKKYIYLYKNKFIFLKFLVNKSYLIKVCINVEINLGGMECMLRATSEFVFWTIILFKTFVCFSPE